MSNFVGRVVDLYCELHGGTYQREKEQGECQHESDVNLSTFNYNLLNTIRYDTYIVVYSSRFNIIIDSN